MALPPESKLTPLFKQWRAIKQDHPDVLVMFRLGDFYEMFGDDAETGARELGLTLTSREGGPDRRIPMCGVPHHALDKYLAMLVHKGYRVAIAEQTGDPKQSKGLVRREVTRVVTPGTLLEDELLDSAQHNFLAAVARSGDNYGVAVVDVSTGDFLVTQPEPPTAPQPDDTKPPLLDTAGQQLPPNLHAIAEEIERIQPTELLLPEALIADETLVSALENAAPTSVTALPTDDFEFRTPAEQLQEFFGVASLAGFGCQHLPAAQAAAALALRYLQENLQDTLTHLTGITTYNTEQFMVIDATTRRNLELERTVRDGTAPGTLLWVLDKTLTPMGKRLLRTWLLQPLLEVEHINRRLEAVQNLVDDRLLAGGLAEQLRDVYDLERLTSRVATGHANGRDLRALGNSLDKLPALLDILNEAQAQMLQDLTQEVDPLPEAAELIERAITDDPPVVITEGKLIKPGYSAELDELREAAAGGRQWIAELEDRERARTGIKSLKVGFNKVFGYYIGVTKPNLSLVPDDYERKQTLVNAERFITPELKEQEAKVLGAEERSQELEYDLFCTVREQVAEHAARILETARALAGLDVLRSLADAAIQYNYCRPEVDDSARLLISAGRHPVVELTQPDEPFVPNDAYLDCTEEQLLIVTGPNMAGKSTYLRQVALICLLAQMGSFVPAKSAQLGMVDRIFTRVGAADELSAGRSTFMVEMTETANILHNATDRSLIILDEIGRGTSTWDGMSLAWAVSEYIVNRLGAKTLFATHYHHLNELAEILPRVRNYRIAVKEQGEEIIFLRKIMPGGTDRSYGIQVARLAGVPGEVIARALEVLHRLEQEEIAVAPSAESAQQIAPSTQLHLFAAAPDPIVEELKSLDLDTMSPIEALMKLKELREKSEE